MTNQKTQPILATPYAKALAVSALCLGLLARGYLVVQPPTKAMLWDHHEYVQWSVQMINDGLFSVHTCPPPETKMLHPTARVPIDAHRMGDPLGPCNYPPLSVMFIYGQACVLHAIDPEMVSNTTAARVIYSVLSMLGELVLAVGCWAIVRQFRNGMAPTIAFVVAWLAPPLIIDSAHWGQTDSWVIAPLVWMLWAMIRQRWLVAGLLWGIALAMKPQAVLAGPIWMIAFFIFPMRGAIIRGGLVGPIVLLLIGVPFTISSGWAWFERSYVYNLLHMYPLTTLKAFNVWYADLLLSENTDAMKTILGITKDMWGKILMVGLFAAASIWTIRRGRGRSSSLVYYTAAWLLITVIAPTRVHERYIVLPLAFLICSAALQRRLWWAVAPLILAATFQITSLDWLTCGAHQWEDITRRTYQQWAEMEANMSPEELAAFPPPQDRLAMDRPRFLEERAATGDPYREWALVLLEIGSSIACLLLLGGCVGKGERTDQPGLAVT